VEVQRISFNRPGWGLVVNRAALIPGLQVSSRASLAAALSVGAAYVLDLRYPIYAMIAAVIVTDLNPAQTRRLAVPRLIGSAVGSTVGAVLSQLVPSGAVAVAVSVLAAMLLCHALGLTDAAKLAGYVCAIVVLDHGGQPWTYGALRLVETALGVGMAVLVGFMPKVLRQNEERSGPELVGR
jgi:uncharacterized membrane protein YgaE (UPF0421/DUF939 family)